MARKIGTSVVTFKEEERGGEDCWADGKGHKDPDDEEYLLIAVVGPYSLHQCIEYLFVVLLLLHGDRWSPVLLLCKAINYKLLRGLPELIKLTSPAISQKTANLTFSRFKPLFLLFPWIPGSRHWEELCNSSVCLPQTRHKLDRWPLGNISSSFYIIFIACKVVTSRPTSRPCCWIKQ